MSSGRFSPSVMSAYSVTLQGPCSRNINICLHGKTPVRVSVTAFSVVTPNWKPLQVPVSRARANTAVHPCGRTFLQQSEPLGRTATRNKLKIVMLTAARPHLCLFLVEQGAEVWTAAGCRPRGSRAGTDSQGSGHCPAVPGTSQVLAQKCPCPGRALGAGQTQAGGCPRKKNVF